MEIVIDRKLFLNKFLIPINKFTDQAIVTLTKDFIECVSHTTQDKQTIILYTKLILKSDISDPNPVILNIGNIKKLISALNCLSNDIIKLHVEKNHIAYKSSEASFKFHLKEDGVITKSPTNIDRINAMTFNTNLALSEGKIDEILKASNFSTDSEKIYMTKKDNTVIGELTDKTITNLDSITILISDLNNPDNKDTVAFKDSIPLKLEIFRLISSIKFDKLNIRINDKGVLVFEINENDYLLKYITSSLIK